MLCEICGILFPNTWTVPERDFHREHCSNFFDSGDDEEPGESAVEFHSEVAFKFHGAGFLGGGVRLDDSDQTGLMSAELRQALVDNNLNECRVWNAPKIEDVLGNMGKGIGGTLSLFLNTISGNKPLIKEGVPMSPKRWKRYVGAEVLSAATGWIPVAGQVIGLGTALISSKAQGKGLSNNARDVVTNLVASSLDGVASIATLGGYAAYTVSAGALATAFQVYTKARYYSETWKETVVAIQTKKDRLEKVFNACGNLGRNDKYICNKRLLWLNTQIEKCEVRGPGYFNITKRHEEDLQKKYKNFMQSVEVLRGQDAAKNALLAKRGRSSSQ